MLGFEQLVNQLQRTGHRRLVVLSGDEAWTLSQVTHLRDTLPGDWLWLEENPSKAISGLLGREYLHAVFDARDGFDVSAFAALSGTLRAGSLLVLLVPPFSVWADRPDRILCAGATAQSRSPPRTLFTTFAGCLPPIQMPSSGINIVLCAFPLRQIYPPGSPPAVNRSASRLKSSTLF